MRLLSALSVILSVKASSDGKLSDYQRNEFNHNWGLNRAKQKGIFDFSQNLLITPSGDFKQVSEEF